MYYISSNSGSTEPTYESFAVYDMQNRQMAIVIVKNDDGNQRMIELNITDPSCDKKKVTNAVKEKGWVIGSTYIVVTFPELETFIETTE